MALTESILRDVGRAAVAHGLTAYAVGGCVRDRVLQRQTKDLDILVLEQGGGIALAQILYKKYGFGHPVLYPRFQTAQTRRDGIEVELVATRKEAYEAISRNPSVASGSLQEDIARRDFTINTLVMPLGIDGPGAIEDITGQGQDDLQKKIIRSVGNPAERFDEDPLRMLRAIRFSCQLSFTIEQSLTDAAQQMHARLAIISKERIKDELQKILLSGQPSVGVQWLADTGLLAFIDTSLSDMIAFDQGTPYHDKDLFKHTMAVLHKSESDLPLRLAALYHDTGKVHTQKKKEGRYVYYMHEAVSARIAHASLKKLTFPNRVVEDTCNIIKLHMVNYSPEWSDTALRRFIHRAGSYLQQVQNLRRADMWALALPHNQSPDITNFDIRIEALNAPSVRDIVSPLNGNQIQKLLKIGPGKKIAEVKRRILDAILAQEIPATVKDAEKLVSKEFLKS